jgi:hypothetical protein
MGRPHRVPTLLQSAAVIFARLALTEDRDRALRLLRQTRPIEQSA